MKHVFPLLGFYTVVHSATPYQKLLDGFSTRSYRIGRCAMLNIIPAVSGAAEAIGKIIPDLNGKVTGLALRVPVPVSAVIDLTVRTCKGGTLVDINDTLKDAAQCSLSGILCYTDEELVSTDITGCNCSLVYDASAGMQLGDKFFKLLAWYDNEYGYSCRLADFLSYMHERDIEAECEKNNDKNKPKAENKPC